MSEPPGGPSRTGAIRVASLPADHVYVQHIADPDGADGVSRLAEPFRGGPPGASWYPSPMLDPGWIRENAAAFDLFHVHFGFDHITAPELADVLGALESCGRPLVMTVHDLRNPHHHDRAEHDRALDVLVPAARAVATLTSGAAAEIARRWGVMPAVIPHPHVVTLERMRRPRRPRGDGTVVGIHLKSVRANMVSLPSVVGGLAAVARLGPAARLRVDLHEDVLRSARAEDQLLVRNLRALAAQHAALDLRIHPFFDDDQLWDYLGALDVSVLPYRFGTHSGWLEACVDLGTAVVAPSCGFYEQQAVVEVYPATERGIDVAGLNDAIVRAARTPVPRIGVHQRLTERRSIARAHASLYASVLAVPPPARNGAADVIRAPAISASVGSRSTST